MGDAAYTAAATHCHLPAHAWAWDRPPTTSVVSEWDLACTSPLISGLPPSSFFAGCFAGSLLLATLVDSLGRKKMLLFGCLLMSVVGALTMAAPNLWIYSALRFVSGFGRATIGTCALVLSTELVGKRWRGQAGVTGFFFFSLGFLSLPAIAYFSRASSWRLLYLWISLPAMLYCAAVYLFVHESPKWLFVRGRKEEAIQTLKRIAVFNGKMLLASFSSVPMEEEPAADMYLALEMGSASSQSTDSEPLEMGEGAAAGVGGVGELAGDEERAGDVGAGLVGVEGDGAPPVGGGQPLLLLGKTTEHLCLTGTLIEP